MKFSEKSNGDRRRSPIIIFDKWFIQLQGNFVKVRSLSFLVLKIKIQISRK